MQNQVSFTFVAKNLDVSEILFIFAADISPTTSKTINNYDDDITEKHKGSVAAPGAALPQRVNFSTISINRNRKLSVAIPVRYLLATSHVWLHAFFVSSKKSIMNKLLRPLTFSVLVLLSLLGVLPVDASTDEYVTMSVGEQRTLSLPSSITSLTLKDVTFTSGDWSKLKIITHTATSVTVEALEKSSAYIPVTCEFYYYTLQGGKWVYAHHAPFYFMVAIVGDDNGGGDTGGDTGGDSGGDGDDPCKLTSISLDTKSLTLEVGQVGNIYATVYPSCASTNVLQWRSSNRDVAFVGGVQVNDVYDGTHGQIWANAVGTCTAICEIFGGSIQAICTIKVVPASPKKVTSISIDESISIKVGNTRKLTAYIYPSDAANKSVTWSSSNTNVATINSNGELEAKNRGKTTVTCEANDGSGVKATCLVTVLSVTDYSYFTAKTVEGTELKFWVDLVSSGVCRLEGPTDKSISGKITIPEEVEGLKVTEISSAFYGCSNISEVVVPNTVETISHNAFRYCTALKKVDLGNGVKSLGSYCFDGCSSLATVTGYDQLESIGDDAFGSSSRSTPWIDSFPDGTIYIRNILYKYKGTMPENTTINVKEGTVQISDDAFFYCKGLIGITIPQSVTDVSGQAFSNCSNLSSIVVAPGNPKYDSRNNCNAIVEKATNVIVAGCKSTTFPSTVTGIGYWAFYGGGISELVIPDNIVSIASRAFSSNNSLKSVVIGKGTKSIDGNPFDGSENLESIVVSSANPYYDSRDNCNAIIEKSTNKLIVASRNTILPQSVKAIGAELYRFWNNIYSITLPDNVEEVGSGAFEFCYGLSSLTIGKNLKKMGASAFGSCSKLLTIHSSIENPSNIDNSVFGDNVYSNATLYVPIGTKAKYQAAEGWKKFKNIVEENAPDMDVVPVSKSVTTSDAGYATFYSSLSAYTLPNGLSARVVSGVSNGKLIYTTIADGSTSTIVPKGTAVLIASSTKKSAQYTLTPSTDTRTYFGTNLLQGSEGGTTTTGDGLHYKLSYGNRGSSLSNEFGWYWGASNGDAFNIEGHRAWLVIPKSLATRSYSLDGGSTGIETIGNSEFIETYGYYDLQGRRISQPVRKGIYILNGKKVTIK